MKFALLLSIQAYYLPFVFISAHALSRFAASIFIYTHVYARDDDTSKIKSVAQSLSIGDLIIAGIFGILPLLLFQKPGIFIIIIPLIVTIYIFGRYIKKWIGGYTGDCLGAAQQLCEIVFYLSFIVLWKYI
jgi:adenosylcobinamide-GDP ribazoletransferase